MIRIAHYRGSLILSDPDILEEFSVEKAQRNPFLRADIRRIWLSCFLVLVMERTVWSLNKLGKDIEGIAEAYHIGGHWGLIPKLQKLVFENKVGYNLPLGTISLMFVILPDIVRVQ